MNAGHRKISEPKEAILERMRLYAARGHPCVPDMTTLRFLNAHVTPEYAMQNMLFQDVTGQSWYFTYFLHQRGDGTWHVVASAGSRGDEHQQKAPPEIHARPWVNVRSFNVGETFYIGGEVIDDTGFDIVLVRLVSPTGLILEDHVQNGLVFFHRNQGIQLPMQAELYTRSNELISRHTVLSLPFSLW